MGIISTLFDGLKDNERIKDLGFAVLGGTLSIIGTKALGIGKDKNENEEIEYGEDFEEDD